MARRVTNHSGRKHANGKVFSALHPDRNYNTKNDPHIDPELSKNNTYWKNPELGIEGKTFNDFEQHFYEKTFAQHIIKTNAKHESSRHYERMIDAEKLRKSTRTAVEDTLIYFGDRDNPLPPGEYDSMVKEFVKWHQETFPQCVILDYATHRDEPKAATHTELRTVWVAEHKDGYLYPNQTKALEQMGFESKGKKRDNAKIAYTKMCREEQAHILRRHGYEVELEPKQGKGGKELVEFQLEKVKEELAEQEKLLVKEQEREQIAAQIKPNKLNRAEVVMPKELAERLTDSALASEHYRAELKLLQAKSKKPEENQVERSLRYQLAKEIQAREELESRFKQLNDCIKQFLEPRKLLERFKEHVAQFKQERAQELSRSSRWLQRAHEQERDEISRGGR